MRVSPQHLTRQKPRLKKRQIQHKHTRRTQDYTHDETHGKTKCKTRKTQGKNKHTTRHNKDKTNPRQDDRKIKTNPRQDKPEIRQTQDDTKTQDKTNSRREKISTRQPNLELISATSFSWASNKKKDQNETYRTNPKRDISDQSKMIGKGGDNQGSETSSKTPTSEGRQWYPLISVEIDTKKRHNQQNGQTHPKIASSLEFVI